VSFPVLLLLSVIAGCTAARGFSPVASCHMVTTKIRGFDCLVGGQVGGVQFSATLSGSKKNG